MKNKGYDFEKDFTQHKGWKRLFSNVSHTKAGDVIDLNGNHYQLKTKDGQMSMEAKDSDTLESLHHRIDREFSDYFIVGIPKGKNWITFTFTKENFKKLLEENPTFWKVQKKSGKGFHYRFSFSLATGNTFKLMKLAENMEKIPKESV